MPTISLFFGVVITMYYDDHNPPHFHARYQGFNASFTFDGELLEGEFPARQKKLVSAWATIHEEDLLANWSLASSGSEPIRIAPLS